MAIAPNSLIFMRKYEVTDFPWFFFLAIFYKLEALMKIRYFKLKNSCHSTQLINIHEEI